MRKLVVFLIVAVLSACASPDRLVYSSGFSFGNYDFVVISKPDGQTTSTTLYGMDVEIANVLTKYSMRVIGDKEFAELSPENKKRTLIARMAVSSSGKHIVLTVSFDDAVTGRTGASITGGAKGDLFDGDDRGKALEDVSNLIIKAMEKDRGLSVSK